MATRPRKSYVLCVANDDHPASLERRKVYVQLADRGAEAEGFVRVIDESGEDYLYPSAYFEPVSLTHRAKRAIAGVV